LIKLEYLRIDASINYFLSSFHILSISNIQQFSNLIDVISLSNLAICLNSWIYFLKKLTAFRNPLSFKIVVNYSNASIATTLLGSGIVSSTKI